MQKLRRCTHHRYWYSFPLRFYKRRKKTSMFLTVEQNFMAHQVLEQNLEHRGKCTAICQTWVTFWSTEGPNAVLEVVHNLTPSVTDLVLKRPVLISHAMPMYFLEHSLNIYYHCLLKWIVWWRDTSKNVAWLNFTKILTNNL